MIVKTCQLSLSRHDILNESNQTICGDKNKLHEHNWYIWKIAIIVHECCRTVKGQTQQNSMKYISLTHNNSGHNIQYVFIYIYIYCFNEKHEIKFYICTNLLLQEII